MSQVMQSENQTDLLYMMRHKFKTIHLRIQAEVLTNEIMFNKIHSGLQADDLTNESNVQDNAIRASGINSN